jgi:hypothetical protein
MDSTAARARDVCLALVAGILLTAFVAFNAAPLWLVVDVVADADDTAQVFYSAQQAWREDESLLDAVHPALTRTMWRLPGLARMQSVRFDPGRRAATYRVLGVRWFRGFLSRDIALDTVTSGRDGMPAVLRQGELELVASDEDPQLIVPGPGGLWLASSLFWPTGAVALVVAGLLAAVWRRRLGLRAMASASVVLATGFYCATIALRGAHLPLYDDWRYLALTSYNLVESGWRWMLGVGNDTYFLTGQVLDFVVLRLSHDNFELLRLFALALLALQVVLTLRVVARATAGMNAWPAFPALLLVGWSLASNAYWGTAVIAYHQFLPVLCGSLLLVQLVGADGTLRRRVSGAAVVPVCLASGLAYISGGLMTLCLALGFLLAQADVLRRDWHDRRLRQILLIGVLGAALLGLQIFLVTYKQGSLLDHTHATRSILPDDRRFWLFACAQFGRALGYFGTSAPVDAALTLVALVPAAAIGVERLVYGLVRGEPAQRPAMTALTLYAGIAAVAYTAAVALGRAGFGAPDASAATMIEIAKGRFHYWPVAALLPFLWLGWVDLALRWHGRLPRAALAAAALAMLLPKSPRSWDLLEFLRFPVTTTARGAHCITQHLEEWPPAPFACPAMTGVEMDLLQPMHHLRRRDSVLYRQIERYRRAPLP